MKKFLRNALVATLACGIAFTASVLTGTPILAFVAGIVVWAVLTSN